MWELLAYVVMKVVDFVFGVFLHTGRIVNTQREIQ